jgi:hypothetical protein
MRRVHRPDAVWAEANGNGAARWRFLAALERRAPEILQTLAEIDVAADDGRLWQRLTDWAAGWNLRDPWIVQIAASTLERWQRHPATMGQWAPSGIGKGVDWPEQPVRWEPFLETESAYRARVNRYVRQTVAVAKEAGLVQRKQRLRKQPARLIDALAGYVVGVPPGELAGELEMDDESTFRKAMHDTAQSIGLTLKLARGRPRKTGK